jgi:hypothetical protein
MRQYFCILVALALCLPANAGVRRRGEEDVDAQRSAAVFVGIRDFRYLTSVPYAIDDAVDLAYEMAIDHDPVLVPPERVVLALSGGEPEKPESRRKLQALLDAGAKTTTAGREEILQSIEAQAARIGRRGILIVSFATHGVGCKGVQHLLTPASQLDPNETETVTLRDIGEIVSRNDVPRSLILVDACRERLSNDGSRAGRADPRSAFTRVMAGVEGEVVISGAGAGGWAYDDEARRNGVFTATLLDGLRCGAAKDWHHFVTVDTLYRYVSREVARWARDHGKRQAKRSTQLVCEGQMRKMPLSICVSRTAGASEPPPR